MTAIANDTAPGCAMKEIKHLFMTYRNGIVADTLRKAGQPFGVIFGLQLPQLGEIASRIGASLADREDLADALWADRNVRESRLLACWLFVPGSIDFDKALSLARSVITREEADILSFRLLRHVTFSRRLAEALKDADEPLARYAGEALERNLDA